MTTFTAMPSDVTGFSGMAVSTDADHAPISVATMVYAPSIERMRQIPGVRYVALATAPPLSGIDMGSSFEIVGHRTPAGATHPQARVTAASAEYALALSTPVVRGRMLVRKTRRARRQWW